MPLSVNLKTVKFLRKKPSNLCLAILLTLASMVVLIGGIDSWQRGLPFPVITYYPQPTIMIHGSIVHGGGISYRFEVFGSIANILLYWGVITFCDLVWQCFKPRKTAVG